MLFILVQFVLRLAFGLALAMIVTPSQLVTSGFFRVHLWVVMGLGTLAALAALFGTAGSGVSWMRNPVLLFAIGTAVMSYVGAVVWLYEKPVLGKVFLAVVTIMALAGALWNMPWPVYTTLPAQILAALDVLTGGLLLGITMAAMLLGHWYLNTPTMKLLPLQRLVLLMGVATLLRAAVSGTGLAWEANAHTLEFSTWLFIGMRWLSGIVATALLVVMTWQTLKIPNTQSATGILYVGVICTFLGELTSQLLSASSSYPL